MKLTKFEIKKLHGYRDYSLKFNDNRLILVGENGAGKTTVLRMLFLLLSRKWSDLAKYNFEFVSVTLNGKRITVSKADIPKRRSSVHPGLRRLPTSIRRRIEMMLAQKGSVDLDELKFLCNEYRIPFHMLMHDLESDGSLFGESSLDKEWQKQKKVLEKCLEECIDNIQILYLPTYRRIEEELGDIFADFDIDRFRRNRGQIMRYKKDPQVYTELVEFGMNDVEEAIERKLEHLKEITRDKLNSLTLAYLGDVVDKKYDTVDVEEIKAVEEGTVKNILDRIDSSILKDSSKTHLNATIQDVKNDEKIDEHQKVICHYFSKLLSFQQELEKEEQGIRRFCEVCNTYMSEKHLEYTSSSFGFKVSSKNNKEVIELSQLSSGEKQIVSLFSHLYLSDDINFFVMIDEPELSLSVPWQKKFLQDISDSDLCSGFISVTHSPFIYDNELEKYAHGLGEFMTKTKKK